LQQRNIREQLQSSLCDCGVAGALDSRMTSCELKDQSPAAGSATSHALPADARQLLDPYSAEQQDN
jgi:hypothetical protein